MERPWPITLCFGYDPKSNGCKPLPCLGVFDTSKCKFATISIEESTLSTDSWRELYNVYLFLQLGFVFFHHFVGMSDEVFRKTRSPNSSFDARRGYQKLMHLNESLAYFYLNDLWNQKFFKIWAMDDCGLKGTWTFQCCDLHEEPSFSHRK